MSDLAREKRRKTKDWSELSEDLLAEISRRIIDYKDFVRFGLVCRSWKSAASMDDYYKARQSAFLLMHCRRRSHSDRLLLYDPTSGQPCDGMILRKPFHRSGVFASQGWLVVLSITDLKPLLRNPVDGTTIHLPDLRCENCYGKILSFEVQQAAISSDPSFTSDYTVILKANVFSDPDQNVTRSYLWQAGGHGGNLPGCNHPGWLMFPPEFSYNIASFRGLLATLHFDGSIHVRGPNTQLLTVPSFPHMLMARPGWFERKYIVESQRGLMVIVQLLDSSSFETKEFRVFELDWASKEWTQVEHLGCRALFLKQFQPPTLLDCNRFVANRIYFLSSLKVSRLEIYNLATKLFELPLQFPLCHRACLKQAQWVFQTNKIKPNS